MGMSLHGWVTSRLRTEYTLSPSLRLTVRQAARLCSVEAHICRGVLDAMVQAGVLVVSGDTYVRADSVAHQPPPPLPRGALRASPVAFERKP